MKGKNIIGSKDPRNLVFTLPQTYRDGDVNLKQWSVEHCRCKGSDTQYSYL